MEVLRNKFGTTSLQALVWCVILEILRACEHFCCKLLAAVACSERTRERRSSGAEAIYVMTKARCSLCGACCLLAFSQLKSLGQFTTTWTRPLSSSSPALRNGYHI